MDIRESLKLVMNSKDLLGTVFYEVFFQRHPEMHAFFSGIDMRRQALVLTMALMLVERYYITSFVATERFLQYLGTQHKKRGIPKELYPHWIAAMLATLERFHGKTWHDQLACQWRAALEKAVEKMLEGYAQEYRI